VAHDGGGADDEQSAQISVSLLRDAMRPVSITARSIGPYRSSIMAIASGELSTFSDTTFRPLSSTMQTCVDSIDRSNPA
jgi:hypothetical protein